MRLGRRVCLSVLGPFATDPPRKLDVLGHDRDALRVNGAQVCVLEESHQVGLRGFLEGQDCVALEPQICLQSPNKTSSDVGLRKLVE